MKKLLFIYNPISGRGLIRQKLSAVLERFVRAGWLVTVRPTLGPGDAARTAAELGAKFDRVVCAGGDGTLSETVSGLMQLEKRPELGFLPVGSTNDCAKNLRLPVGVERCAQLAAGDGVLRPMDVGTLNGKPFTYVAAFGAFTDVAYATPQDLKNTFGHLAYVFNGIAELANLKTHRLRVTGGAVDEEGDFLYGMVGNTYSVAGVMSLSKDRVVLDDGLFEVVLVRREVWLPELVGALQSLSQGRPVDTPSILSFQAGEVCFTCAEPLPWTVDGEYGGTYAEARAVSQKQALHVVFGK